MLSGKKPISEVDILHVSTYMINLKEQNYKDTDEISCYQGFRGFYKRQA